MITDTSLNAYTVFIFLGVFLAMMLSYFFIKNGDRKNTANLYQGILLLALSFSMLEEFLNETGYIVQVISITNFAEPCNFLFGPLFFLYVKRNMQPNFDRRDLLHFIIFLFWLLYMIFYFTQSPEFKYNSYLYCKHPDWPYLEVDQSHSDDPLGIRARTNLWTGIHIGIYMLLSFRLLAKEARRMGISLVKPGQTPIRNIRNISLHFIMILTIFVVVKLSFHSDVGDYFISTYLSFMILTTAFKVMNNSSTYKQSASFLDFPLAKYKKSTLDEEKKDDLLIRIERSMSEEKFYLNHMASLGELSKLVRESKHHISQVINEKLGMNFFELLAKYRVEEAKKILLADTKKQITIETLADQVGYNSKSAFNNAFKKQTGQTPTQFRDS